MVKISNIREFHFSRNPKIVELLNEYDLVKEFGEGVDRIYRDMAQAGLPEPEYRQSDFMLYATLKNKNWGKEDKSWPVHPGEGTDEDIREVFSHEQALGQCSEFLKNNPQIKVTIVANTAMAARMVADSSRTDVAAISSPDCAALYGLNIVKDDIMNSDHNYTRFICISKNMEIFPGASKISMMMALGHTPGSLSDTLVKFSSLGLNLTKIESRPIAGRDFEFMFYLDIDCSIYSEDVLTLIGHLDSEPTEFTFLGSYLEV